MTRGLWFWPGVMAGAMILGLSSALLGDGVWDALSWIALGAPLVIAWFATRRHDTPP